MVDATPFYESSAALEQYLFFHYGRARDYLPWEAGPHDALEYPARAVAELLDFKWLPTGARALDLGCAVGRTSFELSRCCVEVVGLDLSASFIGAAEAMRTRRRMTVACVEEGDRRKTFHLRIPAGSIPGRVRFVVGDAMRIDPALGMFDVAVLLNLIDRVPDPARCLRDLAGRLRPGAPLLIASPYTWMTDYTPKKKWLGGVDGASTFQALKALLRPHFSLVRRCQIPFLIREHARKFQWSMAEGTTWIRKKR